ncbi:conserved hypothetical protein [Echinococcus multilocularis]|uniref:Uncharacterized protein n=1 Tax=Echinococcus multilocularis TaxID=6211 RepID=A0A068Y864_ECHMU|nr:conserved hypothetical protein [Echinococcus multilocularis]
MAQKASPPSKRNLRVYLRMFPFSRSNTSTPAGRSSGSIETSSSNTRQKTENSPLYFSRLFSSPSLRNVSALSPSSSPFSFRRNITVRRDLPPSLFNFHSPIRKRLPQSPQPGPSRPRNAIEFLNRSNSSMMERALRVLESKRQKRSNESLLEDESELEHVSLKRHRSNDENNSSPLLARSVPVPPQDVEVISRPKLKPSTSMTRPSSSKLPDRVSRLSSATLEAIAFGLKRRRPKEGEDEGGIRQNETKRCNSVVSILDENFSPFSSPPAAKRPTTRDCETQTVFHVDSATSTNGSLPSPQHRFRPASSTRSTSVLRFVAGLEARARANALSRRLAASPVNVLTQADSLEARHAKIRRLFADLTEKAEVDLAANSLPATTIDTTGADTTTSSHPDITSSSMPISPITSSVVVSSVTPSSPLKATEPVVVSSETASITAAAVATEPVVAVTPSFAPTLPLTVKASNVGEQNSAPATTAIAVASMMNPPFVLGVKSTVSAETTSSTSTSTVLSISVAPSFSFPVESTFQKSGEQGSSTTTTSTTALSTLPLAKSTSAFGQTSFGGTAFSLASSATSASSVVVTSSAPGSIFALAKSTASGGNTTVSFTPSFNFFAASKSSIPVVSATVSFAPLVTASSGLSSLASSVKDNPAPSSAPLFSFPTTITTASNTATVAAAATTSDGTFFSPAMTTTSDAAASSNSLTVSSVQSGFSFRNTAPITAPSTSGASSLFNFSAKPVSINTTVGMLSSTAPSTLTPPAFNLSSKPDTTKTSPVFPAPSTTTSSVLVPAKSMPVFSFVPTTSTTTAPALFDFSTKATKTTCTTIGQVTMPVVNFGTAGTTAVATTAAASVPFVFSVKSAFSNGETTSPPFSFPSMQITPTATVATTTASTSPFPFPKTNTSGLTNGGSSGGPFGTAPFRFQSSSNVTSVTSTGGCFTFTSPSTIATATTTTPVSFSFTNTVTTATPAVGGSSLGGFNFSSSVPSVTGSSSTPFATKLATGVFQFGAQPTAAPATITTTSSGFNLTLPSTKSSPSIFSSIDHTKRTGDSSFTDGLSASKIQASAFGGGAVNPSSFGGTGLQPFTFGGSSSAASAGGGGFNFSAAATNPVGSFNFSQVQPAPVFGGAGGVPPNPFSAVAPTPPNAAASIQHRRRQMRYSRRR